MSHHFWGVLATLSYCELQRDGALSETRERMNRGTKWRKGKRRVNGWSMCVRETERRGDGRGRERKGSGVA